MKRILPYLVITVIFVLICGSMIHNKKDRFEGIETSTENTEETTEYPQETTEMAEEYICFGSEFHTFTGLDTDATISYLEEMGEGNYIDIYATSDDEVYIALNNDQHEFWVNAAEEKIQEQESVLQEVSPLYYCSYSDDYTEIYLYYDMSNMLDKLDKFIPYVGMYCAMYQIIEGNDEISLYLNVYNKDTGKLVMRGDLHEYFSYEVADWSESYHLTEDEEEEFLSNIEDDSIKTYNFYSNIYDGISVTYIFNIACGNNYDYLYINDEDVIVVGLTDDKQQDCLIAIERLINAEQEDFADLGTNYKVDISDDYKVIDFYFDANLDEQEQMNNFGNFEILCMLYQELDMKDYYTEFNIYNSETGELISTGDTETGLSWKME